MKRRVLLAACLCMMGAAVFTGGCSNKKADDKVVEEKEPELELIGTESEDAYKVELKNSTGKNITGVSVKLTEETEYPANMLETGDVFEADESRYLYYAAPDAEDAVEGTAEDTEAEDTDAAAEGEENADAKVVTQGYDIQLTFEDSTTAELHSFPFEDIEEGEICFSDEVAYVSYTSVSTEDKVETKEAELNIKVQKEEAAKKAAEEAAAKAAAEEAAAKAAAEQAAAEAAAQQAAEQQQAEQSYYEDYSYDYSYSEPEAPADTTGDDDACLGGGIFY